MILSKYFVQHHTTQIRAWILGIYGHVRRFWDKQNVTSLISLSIRTKARIFQKQTKQTFWQLEFQIAPRNCASVDVFFKSNIFFDDPYYGTVTKAFCRYCQPLSPLHMQPIASATAGEVALIPKTYVDITIWRILWLFWLLLTLPTCSSKGMMKTWLHYCPSH